MNKLFHVQDADRPMFIVAADWTAALEAWRNLISREDDLDTMMRFQPELRLIEPEGIMLVCGSDDLLIVEPVAISD